jgi:hypothetical protein
VIGVVMIFWWGRRGERRFRGTAWRPGRVS